MHKRTRQAARDILITMIDGGFRINEASKMKWSDIDFKRRIAKLHKGKTKNTKPRYLPLTPPVIQELMKHKENAEFHIFH